MLSVPELPAHLMNQSAWHGPQMRASSQWQWHLNDTEIRELESAATRCLENQPDISLINRNNFSLPVLGQRLRVLHDQLIHGVGFALIRSLPVDTWTRELSAAVFYGLGAHLGHARPQNAKGHLLGHVIDMGLRADDPNVRIYQTHERQTFHTDSCDIVGLLCLQQAKSGGDSALVSSNTIYNEMRRTQPVLACALFDPIATDRRGEIPEGQKPFFEIPVFNWHDGLMSTIYQRQYIDSAQRFDQAMRLTSLHIEALDCFDQLANDSRMNFLMRLEPGDMQFVHNHNLLHDRTAFEDWNAPEKKRHLLRLWLSSPEARSLPAVFAQRYGSLEPGLRGGVMHTDAAVNAPLYPG